MKIEKKKAGGALKLERPSKKNDEFNAKTPPGAEKKKRKTNLPKGTKIGGEGARNTWLAKKKKRNQKK